jgi:hypothetical protein
MLKAGPRHLTIRQWQAAQIFRSAYEVLEGAVGNTNMAVEGGSGRAGGAAHLLR